MQLIQNKEVGGGWGVVQRGPDRKRLGTTALRDWENALGQSGRNRWVIVRSCGWHCRRCWLRCLWGCAAFLFFVFFVWEFPSGSSCGLVENHRGLLQRKSPGPACTACQWCHQNQDHFLATVLEGMFYYFNFFLKAKNPHYIQHVFFSDFCELKQEQAYSNI